MSDYLSFLSILFLWITRVLGDDDVRSAALRTSRGNPEGEVRDWAELDDIVPLEEVCGADGDELDGCTSNGL